MLGYWFGYYEGPTQGKLPKRAIPHVDPGIRHPLFVFVYAVCLFG